MQRQKRISDATSIGTPPPIRMETDKSQQLEKPHLSNRKPKLSVMERTFSSDSAVVRTAVGVKEYFKDYCLVTAIHGVRYFAEDGRYRVEKIFWMIALALSMMFCFHLIIKVYQKWDTNPVIVSFAETSTSIWQVPFPAVSICPETKSAQTKFNFTEKYYIQLDYLKNATNTTLEADFTNITMLTDDELTMLEAVSLLCDKHVLTKGAMYMTNDAIEDLKTVAPAFLDIMVVCKWQGKIIDNCTNLFKPVWSDEGICYTFNMLDNTELFTKVAVQYSDDADRKGDSGWDLENGYPLNGKLDTFPNRALGAGAQAGLYILLKANNSDLDFLCRGPVQGFKILLHNPAEIPRIGQQYFRVPLNQEIVAAVKPSMMTTSRGLHDYAAHRRQCYFPRERQLRFFKVYTQKNCELECITNFTLRRCGCVAFYMPRDNETLICGPGSTNCTVNAFEESVREEIQNDLERMVQEETSSIGSKTTECDCLASCVSLEYDAETSQADYNWRSVFMAYRENLETLGQGLMLSRISIFFKDIQFITSHRSELYGPTDFLANCGGLLGLFSGFSFLSLVEIFYFLTLRLWCRVKNRRSKARASKDLACNPEKEG